MTDFVLEQFNKLSQIPSQSELVEHNLKLVKYAKFLKKPLVLEMLIPCLNGEPFNYSKHGNLEQDQQAKEKVLFEGAVIHDIQPSTESNYITLNGVKIANQHNNGKYYILLSLCTIERLHMLLGDLTLTQKEIKT